MVRRTTLTVDGRPDADVVVLDTIGELARLYQIASVVFVGGSLVDAGGHNILEPAMFGKADRLRPAHAQLRRDCRRRSSRNGAAVQVSSTRELGECLVDWSATGVRRARLGAAARASSRPTAAPRPGRWPWSPRCCRRATPDAAASCMPFPRGPVTA